MTLRALALVVVVACSGSPKHAAEPTAVGGAPPSTNPTCDQAAARYATIPDRDAMFDVRGRCEADAWPEHVRSCFASVGSRSDAIACQQMLQVPAAAAAASDTDADAPRPEAKKVEQDAAPKTRGPVKKSKNGADPCEGGQ
jgi:hypothetical protein